MAPTPNIWLARVVALVVLLPVEVVPAEYFPGDHHGYTDAHRLLWPIWYRQERFARTRHDREGSRDFQQSTARSPSHLDTVTGRPVSTVPPPVTDQPRRHVDQRAHEQRPAPPKQDKSNVAPVAKYAGTAANAYHNNHRHQLREAATQRYQHVATTPATYRRHHPGRRVCTRSVPSSSLHHRQSRQLRYYNYVHIQTDTATSLLCCPGWTQATQLSFGCNKPTCRVSCLNGGICTAPGRCTCPKGFTGNQCQTDIDECVREKPCDQLCRNLPGSYECHCKPGFQLQKDGQSCRKNDTDDIAFEARDLEEDFLEVTTTKRPSNSPHDTENEVADGDLDQDYEIILKRLTKLEKLFAKGKKKDTETTEMSAKVASVMENINEMKRTVENVQLMQQEIYEMRTKLREYEMETRKMQHLTNRVMELENRLRLRCRTAIPMNSGTLHF
ncbi:epidermal growth factor-like protein slowdown [Halictus rubicundus]|uniref:epidermal growth factor-like protein slowdown n=1 Tax=Halictus rubicundus TaxID=77578 RepID=UPI00403602E7